MDIEKLTKSQIVLLTLLVSFVTSIATGIVTVSLVDQAPTAITQSVSRIIRETVQNAVPITVGQPAAVADAKPARSDASSPTLAQLIAGADRSIVRLYGGTADSPVFLGLGLLLDTKGTVLTDYEALGTQESVTAMFDTGSSTPMSVITRDTANDAVYIVPSATTTAQIYPATFAPAPPQVGDTVIAFAGTDSLRIASGLVTGNRDGPLQLIDTNAPASALIKGSPLMNAQGQFVGISTGASRAANPAAFMPISAALFYTVKTL